jgi:hypothetical protein
MYKYIKKGIYMGKFKDYLNERIQILSDEKIDVYVRKTTDLSTYESRVNLKNELIKINEELKPELQKLEEYILKRYTIKDLLK